MNKLKTVKLTRELLEESTLTEEFSPSMPEWLKNALRVGDAYDQWDYDKKRKKKDHLNKIGVDTNQIMGGNLIKKLANIARIDLNNARFFTGAVPENSRDDRLKDPYLPIFLLEDEYGDKAVWAKGVNDDTRLEPISKEQFKYTSMKKILEHAVAFCYIDLSDPKNFLTDKRDARAQMARDLKNLPNYYRARKKDWDSYNTDKSGYIVDPDKYRNKLAKLQRDDVQGILDKLHGQLTAIQQRIATTLSSADVRDFGTEDKLSEPDRLVTEDIFKEFRSVCKRYNYFCSRIEQVTNDNNLSQQEKDNLLDVLIISTDQDASDLKKIQYAIKSLNQALTNVYKAKISWR